MAILLNHVGTETTYSIEDSVEVGFQVVSTGSANWTLYGRLGEEDDWTSQATGAINDAPVVVSMEKYAQVKIETSAAVTASIYFKLVR